MKVLIIFLFLSSVCLVAHGQANPLIGPIAETKALLSTAKTDSARLRLMLDISFFEVQSRTDSSLAYARQACDLARKINDRQGLERGLIYLGIGERYLADYPKAMDCELKALQLAEKLDDKRGLEYAYSFLGAIAQDQGYYETGLINMNRSLKYGAEAGEVFLTTGTWGELTLVYAETGKIDSALYSYARADSMNRKYGFYFPHVPYGFAYVLELRGDYGQAIEYYRLSGQYASRNHFLRDILRSYTAIGRVQMKTGNTDSAIYYAENVLRDRVNHSIPVMLEAVEILNEGYDKKQNKDSMLKYLKFAALLRDSLFGQGEARRVQNLNFNEAIRQQLISEEKAKMDELRRKNSLKLWFGGAVAGILLLALFVFYRYRITQLLKLQSVRNGISRDLHDDIGSTLSGINILSEVAERQMEAGQPEQSIDALRKIKTYSYEMAEKMGDIVWAVNPRNDNVEGLVLRTRNALSELCRQQHIDLSFEADDYVGKTQLSSKAAKNLYMVCKEAVNNAMKHSGCSKITVSFAVGEGILRLVVVDDGSGFDPGMVTMGNGLQNMRSRMEELHGTVDISSVQGSTMVTFQTSMK